VSSPSLEQEFEIYASVVREKLTEFKRDAMASDFVQAVTAGRAAIDGLRSLSTYANEVKDISKRGEFMRVVGELSLELAEVQMRLGETIRENNDLEEQVNTLKKEVESLKNPDTKLMLSSGLYYASQDKDPFCTGCYDNNGKMIRVTKLTGSARTFGEYRCPICNNVYGKSEV